MATKKSWKELYLQREENREMLYAFAKSNPGIFFANFRIGSFLRNGEREDTLHKFAMHLLNCSLTLTPEKQRQISNLYEEKIYRNESDFLIKDGEKLLLIYERMLFAQQHQVNEQSINYEAAFLARRVSELLQNNTCNRGLVYFTDHHHKLLNLQTFLLDIVAGSYFEPDTYAETLADMKLNFHYKSSCIVANVLRFAESLPNPKNITIFKDSTATIDLTPNVLLGSALLYDLTKRQFNT